MRIDILTIFPRMFEGPLQESMMGRAQENGILEVGITDIRDFAFDKHRCVDDYPFGGGPGMVMKAEPIFAALEYLRHCFHFPDMRTILLCPQGEVFTQAKARELAQLSHLVLICGHYEGIDERVRQQLVTDEISIGDYILTGGELPAMVVVDAVARLLPGVLGDVTSVNDESFSDGLLEYPQYTRPREYRGSVVPEVLLSGNHEEIRRWRRRESLRRTLLRRPELLERVRLSAEDIRFLEELREEK